MNKIFSVLRFEYLTLVKSTSFVVMTIIMALAGLILPAAPSVGGIIGESLTGGGNRAAVSDPSGLFSADVWARYMADYDGAYYESAALAQAAVEAGDRDFGVLFDGYGFALYVPEMNISYYSVANRVEDLVRSEYRLYKLAGIGLTGAEAEAILNYTPPSRIVAAAAPEGDSAGRYQENIIYAYVMIFLLYFAMILYGQYVLISVIREKTTKTMELLITSCKPSVLINGKVLGVGLAGFTQMAVIALAALISMRVAADGTAGAVSVSPQIIGFMVIFFILGFFAFAYMYAALGSTVSRMEDANAVATLPILLIMAGFFIALFGLLNPGSIGVVIASYVPFVLPMVMFMRVCLGTAVWWEACAAAAVQAAAIVGAGWLGARIYRMGTLMYGNPLKLKEIIRMLR